MAAINRFMRPVQKDFTWQTPQLEVWSPNASAWLETLDQQQAKYNTLSELEGLVPKHLQQDVPDVNAYTQAVQSDIDKVTEAFASGDIVSGNRMLRDVTSRVRRAWQPGGEADMFQQRLAKYNETDKRLQETYLDPKSKQYAPELYKYYKNKIQVQPYKTDTGYGTIGEPTTYQYFGPEEWTKYIDTTLGNISADQVALKPGLVPSGVPLKDFFKTGNMEYIDKDKVLNTLVGSVPPEMLKSLQVYSDATGTDAVSSIQRMLESAAQGKAFKKYDYNYQGVTDEVAMEELKSRLRKQEKKEEFALNDISLRTQIYNSNSGMPDWNNLGIDVDDKGNIFQKSESFNPAAFSSSGTNVSYKTSANVASNVKFKDWIWTEKAPQQIKNIANEFATDIQGMSDKQAKEFIEQKYNEKKQLLSNTDAIINPYDEKERKMWSDYLLGTTKGKEGATAGAMFLNDMTATTTMPGEVSTTTGLNLGQKMGLFDSNGRANAGALKRFIENAVVSEKVEVPSGEMPSGHKVSYVDEDGKVWSFMLGPRSLQEEALNSDAYRINQLKKNDAVDVTEFQPVHPILREYFPNGINVESRDVYQSDVIYQQWFDAFKNNNPKASKLREQYDDLKNSPYKNSFVMKDIRLLDPVTKQPVPMLDDDGKPIQNEDGTIRYWTDSDVNKLTRNTEIK